MDNAAKILIVGGLTLAVLGLLLMALPKFGITLFRLPGDVVYKKGSFTLYFPIATSIVISIVLTVILWLFRK
jgi:hypothetical protein